MLGDVAPFHQGGERRSHFVGLRVEATDAVGHEATARKLMLRVVRLPRR